jgi:uncharacterized protein (TIGR00251 family)
MTVHLRDHADGCVLPVRAQPGARRNAIIGEQGGALKVAVTAAPEKGRANDAIILVLADSLGLKRSQVELLGGPASRAKTFLVRNVTAEVLRQKLRVLLDL